MALPDSNLHNPKPSYILGLLKRANLSQRSAASLLGISERSMRYYVAEGRASQVPIPYPAQYALEVLADAADAERTRAQPEVAAA